MEGHKFEKGDQTFTFLKLDKLNGEASISVRKGKQIICYQFDSDVEWRAETKTSECNGSFTITDINEAELDFEVWLFI